MTDPCQTLPPKIGGVRVVLRGSLSLSESMFALLIGELGGYMSGDFSTRQTSNAPGSGLGTGWSVESGVIGSL